MSKQNKDIEDGDRLSEETLLPETELPRPRQPSSVRRKILGIHITIASLYTSLFLVAWHFQVKNSQRFLIPL
jgi:hypothetical protein